MPGNGPWRLPSAEGLYDPSLEHDACGVGFIVNISGQASHKVLQRARTLSVRLTHRGAEGAEANLGDGAGVMMGIPKGFYRQQLKYVIKLYACDVDSSVKCLFSEP